MSKEEYEKTTQFQSIYSKVRSIQFSFTLPPNNEKFILWMCQVFGFWFFVCCLYKRKCKSVMFLRIFLRLYLFLMFETDFHSFCKRNHKSSYIINKFLCHIQISCSLWYKNAHKTQKRFSNCLLSHLPYEYPFMMLLYSVQPETHVLNTVIQQTLLMSTSIIIE